MKDHIKIFGLRFYIYIIIQMFWHKSIFLSYFILKIKNSKFLTQQKILVETRLSYDPALEKSNTHCMETPAGLSHHTQSHDCRR